MARVIVVFGATGSQGGGVAKALLKDKRFQVRCVTRNTESPKAQALASLGKSTYEYTYCSICIFGKGMRKQVH